MTDHPDIPPPPWGDKPYSIKRYGVTITNCDSEPVQTPGCVQAHGALLVLRPGDLTIVQASESTTAVLGRAPGELLGQGVASAIGEDGEARLREALAHELVERDPLYVLTRPALASFPPLDVTVHTIDGDGVVVVELEPQVQTDTPECDYYRLVRRSLEKLRPTDTLASFCHASATAVRAITGFDRVMIYRFHADNSGEVFAESRIDELPPWLGLRYPETDIPRPAREIFRKCWVRPVPDVSGELAELVPLVHPETGRPLEMVHCALRGPSVMYTEYLQNMKVTAALTMSIRRGDDLWGLIACHHYSGPKPVAHDMRAACELVAQAISLLRQAAEDREELDDRLRLNALHEQLVARAAQEPGLASLVEGTPSLLDGISAGGVAILQSGRWSRAGVTPTDDELDVLADWISARLSPESPDHIYTTDSLARHYPPAAAYVEVASGVLAFSSPRPERTMILWLRPETVKTVNWAGNPHDKPVVPGPHGDRLTPRVSFELWQESVRERSTPWTTVEIEAAARLGVLVERHALENALRSADRQKDVFIATLAHELRNPLAPISTGLRVLKAAPPGSHASARAHEIMERQIAHMVRLIDDLLDVSRISRGRVELRRERLDVDAVIDRALEASRPLVEAAGHTLTVVRASGAPLRIVGDLVRLAQVLCNLLHNATKYTPSGGRIEVECAREGEQVLLRVKDSGVGISPEMLPKVFDLFVQETRSLDKAQGGLGIGLSLAHKLVRLHGGSITAASPGVGLGSTFTVRLPLASEAEVEPTSTAGDHVAPVPCPRRRVLVVDDNVDGAESLATMLELQGHETRIANDGLAALAAVKEFHPDLVFIDIGMPGMDGYEVARRLRAETSAGPMVLVALTGWGAEDDRRRAREAGFDLHLTKPAGIEQVQQALAGL